MKRSVSYLSFTALFVALALTLSSLFHTLEKAILPSSSVKGEGLERVIIIDAGHGGMDGGATGTTGVLEKHINLEISRMLADLLRGAGYCVVETRTDDRLLGEDQAIKGHKKQADLSARLALSDAYPDSIFISIHMNSYQGVSCHGLQVWYSQNNSESKEWAQAIQQGVKARLQPENNRKIKAATSSIYLLRHAKNPAILIECGFLSTEEECERLSTPDYQHQLALTLFGAIGEKMQDEACAKK
ncbi:MAG: cell wall hydrolase [Ruminococcaceae bacterium]|nr:cell wall hydrolase [Oscillospiraceae bacterium]